MAGPNASAAEFGIMAAKGLQTIDQVEEKSLVVDIRLRARAAAIVPLAAEPLRVDGDDSRRRAGGSQNRNRQQVS